MPLHWNPIRISGPLRGEPNGDRWFPPTKVLWWYAENMCFCGHSFLTVEQTVVVPKYEMPWRSLTHWDRVTHICVAYLTIIASDNGLSPSRRQAFISTSAGILLIGSLGTNFNEILIEIHIFSINKINLKMSSGKCRPFCLGLNELNGCLGYKH